MTERRKAVWLNLNDSTKCGNVDFKFWESEGLKLKKKKKDFVRGERLFLCSLVYKLSVSYSTFPSSETSPQTPPNPHPFYPGSNLLLMHPRRHVDRQEIPQIRPTIPFSVPDAYKYICTHTPPGNIPTRNQLASASPPVMTTCPQGLWHILGGKSNNIAQKTCNVETVKHF